jgi:tripartite-type tricarboxylate transporter receptor subunit TctC
MAGGWSRQPGAGLRLAAAGASLAAPALAQGDWPNRPVRIIVPFPPGQSTDIVARLLADDLSRRWPQRVVVENRAGGAGAPALEMGARSAPDGYTLVAGSIGPLAVNPAVMARLPYDPERDFAPITNLTLVPLAIIAHPAFAANAPQDLAAAARGAARPIDLATAGPASGAHMAAEFLAHSAGRCSAARCRAAGGRRRHGSPASSSAWCRGRRPPRRGGGSARPARRAAASFAAQPSVMKPPT